MGLSPLPLLRSRYDGNRMPSGDKSFHLSSRFATVSEPPLRTKVFRSQTRIVAVRWRWAAALFAIGIALGTLLWRKNVSHDRPSQYAHPGICAGCHAEIARTYAQTGMGRSFFKPRQDRRVEDFVQRNTYVHGASEQTYSMFLESGSLYQKRSGAAVEPVRKRVDYVLGSGNHSRTYLYRGPGGRLYQMPLAWYSANGGFWAMSPGYDRPDHKDFRRAITYDCMFCHNGYPRDETLARVRAGADPVFPAELPEGIDCQRCHGPGQRHADLAARKKPAAEVRASIFNPKHASRDRQLEVCMQCHLETTSRPLPYSIVRYERGLFSYRPGEPLSDYILHFDHAPQTGFDDKFEIAHAAYRLRKSRCFAESALTCTTCHDPHRARRGQEAADFVKTACVNCHKAAHNPGQNCTACHMPKRRTDDVVQVVMTDHLIQRRPLKRDLLAALAEKPENDATHYRDEVVPYYPAADMPELYAAVAQVAEGSNVAKGLPRLAAALEKHRPEPAQFYFELAEAFVKSGDLKGARKHYEETLRRDSSHLAAIRNAGAALRSAGDFAAAAAMLERAPEDAAALATLGDVYLALGRGADSVRVLRKAIELDPESPEAWNNLGQTLGRNQERAEAIAALRAAIRVRPGYAVAHNNLANQLIASGDFDGAQEHFLRALRYHPRYAEAHYNFGTALAQRQNWRGAASHLEAAVALNPGFGDAHNNLGNVYAAQGLAVQAAASFRRALYANPALDSARLNLAVALAAAGRASEALEEMKKAARSGDPGIREAALRGLEALGGQAR